jgi:hypothetical protein
MNFIKCLYFHFKGKVPNFVACKRTVELSCTSQVCFAIAPKYRAQTLYQLMVHLCILYIFIYSFTCNGDMYCLS